MQNQKNSGEPGNQLSKLSKDGKWRSFPKIPHLLQYVSSGAYYARVKVNGKVIRQSLNTDVKTTAKLRLVDYLKNKREATFQADCISFKSALNLFLKALDNDSSLKESSREYRKNCIRKIELSWRDLWQCEDIRRITPDQCQGWARNLHRELAAQYFNNVIGTLKMILDHGFAEWKKRGGGIWDNPADILKRTRVAVTDLKLPETEQFRALVANIRKSSGGWGPRSADLIEFFAYSGMRLNTEAHWVAWGDVDWDRKEIVVRGDPITRTKNWEIRRIPLLPDMERLLSRLREENDPVDGADRIIQVDRCYEALRRACVELGIPRLSHHDLRHLFATRCIESGVDIPTVARWLGHKDGGALAMKTYGHLRNEHSQAMAAKVKF